MPTHTWQQTFYALAIGLSLLVALQSQAGPCSDLVSGMVSTKSKLEISDYHVTTKFIDFGDDYETAPFIVIPNQNILVGQFRNQRQNVLSVINLSNGAIESEAQMGRSPWQYFQTSSDGSQFALISERKANIYKIQSLSHKIVKGARIDLPTEKSYFRLSPNFKWVISNDYLNREISVSPLVRNQTFLPNLLSKLVSLLPNSRSTPDLISIPGADFEFKTLAFSPDGESIVLPSEDHSHLLYVRLSDPLKAKSLPVIAGMRSKINSVAINKDGLIATFSRNGPNLALVTLIDTSGKFHGTIPIQADHEEEDLFGSMWSDSMRLQFSPNGEILAMTVHHGLYFYSFKENRMLKSNRGHKLELSKTTVGATTTTKSTYPSLNVNFMPDNRTALVEFALGLFEIEFENHDSKF